MFEGTTLALLALAVEAEFYNFLMFCRGPLTIIELASLVLLILLNKLWSPIIGCMVALTTIPLCLFCVNLQSYINTGPFHKSSIIMPLLSFSVRSHRCMWTIIGNFSRKLFISSGTVFSPVFIGVFAIYTPPYSFDINWQSSMRIPVSYRYKPYPEEFSRQSVLRITNLNLFDFWWTCEREIPLDWFRVI